MTADRDSDGQEDGADGDACTEGVICSPVGSSGE